MNDFAQKKNPPVGISPARRVGEVNRALDAVAKAEFLGEFDREVAGGEHVAVGANALDDFAAIMRKHLRLHGLHDVGPAKVDFLGDRRCC